MLDVAQLVEGDAVVARDEPTHPRSELHVGSHARLVDDELHAQRKGLGPRELGELAVHLGELAHHVDGGAERPELGEGALEDRRAQLVARHDPAHLPAKRRPQEAIRGLDSRRLGHRDGDGHVGREHQVDRQVALPRPDVHDEVVGGQRPQRAEPAHLPSGAQRDERADGVVRERKLDQHDALAELREVHGEVHRDEALADSAPTSADGDEAPDALHAEVARGVVTPASRCAPVLAHGLVAAVIRARRSSPKTRAPSSGARNGFTT